MKGTEVDGTYNRLFIGQMESVVKCLNVDFESKNCEDFTSL
jgi:ubiquitin carboxyl-terminal hydrolase 7